MTPNHVILEIHEHVDDVVGHYGAVILEGQKHTFRVSTRKIAKFTQDELGRSAYRFVKQIVDDAWVRGLNHIRTQRKYSFSNWPELFLDLQPDDLCQDPVKTIDVDISR